MLLLRRLKIILQSNSFYVFLVVFVLIITFVRIKYDDNRSIYSLDDKEFSGIVKEYNIKEDKITIEISGKENLIVAYKFKDKDAIRDIKYGYYIKEENYEKLFSKSNY